MTYYFWGYNDGIIGDVNGMIACETCPCTGTGTVGEDCVYCGGDGSAPYQIAVGVPALNHGGCLDCDAFEGTYVITQVNAKPCSWTGRFSNPSTCVFFGGTYDGLLINMEVYNDNIFLELVLTNTAPVLIADVGWWRWDLGTGTGMPICMFDGFEVPPLQNGVCSPVLGSNNLTLTAV